MIVIFVALYCLKSKATFYEPCKLGFERMNANEALSNPYKPTTDSIRQILSKIVEFKEGSIRIRSAANRNPIVIEGETPFGVRLTIEVRR